jgi:hypothetical protein
MSLSIDLKKFNELYNIQLLPKEQILKDLNITEYFYKKIIKEFKINRIKRTSEFERIKNANKDFITVIKISDEDKPKTIKSDKMNALKNIERRQKETKPDENKYNQAINEAMNILKTSKRTLKDKEIF